ncbi:protein phosphatase, partial [Cryptococcus neoformans MW-RSA852]
RLSILCAASLCCILVALPAYPPRDNSTMGQGQSSSKKLGRTSSKQLPPQDLADSLARTSIADRDAAAGHPPPPDALSP